MTQYLLNLLKRSRSPNQTNLVSVQNLRRGTIKFLHRTCFAQTCTAYSYTKHIYITVHPYKLWLLCLADIRTNVVLGHGKVTTDDKAYSGPNE